MWVVKGRECRTVLCNMQILETAVGRQLSAKGLNSDSKQRELGHTASGLSRWQEITMEHKANNADSGQA
ncbi:hypothetical protein RRG08_031896 [Elysia crispata]|uniref:Uncharacterized protein n=1 Tax=Elysia crispata TaxID=231223 RepID=A0AAE1DZ48_9GAST|nr:hypothetical protein RRG08_031896 [Elysia crispata]